MDKNKGSNLLWRSVMASKSFLLEIVLDRSHFEKSNNRGKFHYKTKSVFVRFRADPKNLKKTAKLRFERFRRKSQEAVVAAYVYQKLPQFKI